jgi:3,4-dihydroxy 2-butanone 4-phosphate synthase/GTP cyclohydrolase II
MTNNPRKVVGLEGYGLKITEAVPLEIASCDTNIKYLTTKKEKMAHTLSLKERAPKAEGNAS